jgi:hypothetical protein
MQKILLVLLLASATSFAQTTVSPSSSVGESVLYVLNASSRVLFNIPMFSATGRVGCDVSGNLYFNVSSNFPIALHDGGPFLKVNADGSHYQIFTPHMDSKVQADTLQGVSPDGTFYILVQSAGRTLVQTFNGDGGFLSNRDIEIPSDVTATQWAIQNSGVAFVSGYIASENSDKEMVKRGYAAMFAPSGKLQRVLPDLIGTTVVKDGPAPAPEGDVVAGDDGRFYLLTPTKIVVLNQTGEMQNTIHFTKPTSSALAERIDVSGGVVSLVFQLPKSGEGHAGEFDVSATLLNAQDGEVIRSFGFADSLTNSVACFQRNEGYSFMAVQKGMAGKDVVPVP